MREIKFRSWDTKNKEMLETVTPGQMMSMVSSISALCGNTASEYDFDMRLIYMQYTGLHDKNGKEIYEGDIFEIKDEENSVKHSGEDDMRDFTCLTKIFAVVKYNSSVCRYELETISYHDIYEYVDEPKLKRTEVYKADSNIYYLPEIAEEDNVVGNIYENPELLK